MEDLDVCAGELPQFAVVVEGKPIPDILWFKVCFEQICLFSFFSCVCKVILNQNLFSFFSKNDVLLSEGSHFTFVYDDNECSLVILNAQPEDSGVYTCTARNLAGSVSCKAELTVHEGNWS